MAINRAEAAPGKSRNHWRVFPKDPMEGFRDLRRGTEINRNRDMDWVRTLEKKSSERRIGLWAHFTDTDSGFALTLTDEDGFTGTAEVAHAHEPATDAARAEGALREQIGRFGATIFHAHDIAIAMRQPWFVPASVLNPLRRDAVAALEAARSGACSACPARAPWSRRRPSPRTPSPTWPTCSTRRRTTST